MIRSVAAAFLPLFLVACTSSGAFETASLSGTVVNSYASMKTQGRAYPPVAFKAFCAREPRLCSTAGGTKTMKLTDARMTELKSVNSGINGKIRERADPVRDGRADDWRLPVSEGDCEDFAIAKKNELLKRGWPASVLLLTVATYGGEGHTVLTVRTDKGDMILDNRTNSVRVWSSAPYKFFARQSQSNGGVWERI